MMDWSIIRIIVAALETLNMYLLSFQDLYLVKHLHNVQMVYLGHVQSVIGTESDGVLH